MPSPDLSGRWSGGMWLVTHVEVSKEVAERLWERGIPDSLPEDSLAVLSCFGPWPEDRIVAVERREEGQFVAVVERVSL
jgi:hypothetical protein